MSILAPQIAFVPKVVGALPKAKVVVVGGMGGSALPGLVLKEEMPDRIIVHRDYGLPSAPPDTLYVAVSYSGNTEETLSFFDEALGRGNKVAVVAGGGALLARAKEAGVPYVLVPEGFEPRDQLLTLLKSLLAVMGEGARMHAWEGFPHVEEEVRGEAAKLASACYGRIPLVYSSARNDALAHIGKITLNETGKVPAFRNRFPEVNHNEMQGIDPLGGTLELSRNLLPVLLYDQGDDARIRHRMDVFASLLEARGMPCHLLSLPSKSRAHTLLFGWFVFREASHMLAERYGVAADETPLIKEFKERL